MRSLGTRDTVLRRKPEGKGRTVQNILVTVCVKPPNCVSDHSDSHQSVLLQKERSTLRKTDSQTIESGYGPRFVGASELLQ